MDLEQLAKRVEEAERPDRILDGQIMFVLFAKAIGEQGFIWPADDPNWAFAMRFPESVARARKHMWETIEWQSEDGDWILMNNLRVPELTSSFDAALSLLDRDQLDVLSWGVEEIGRVTVTINIGGRVARFQGNSLSYIRGFLAAVLRAVAAARWAALPIPDDAPRGEAPEIRFGVQRLSELTRIALGSAAKMAASEHKLGNGETALYWHLVAITESHLAEDLAPSVAERTTYDERIDV